MRDRLYRARDDRMLFGVAGGMARYFRIDPALVRLVWVLLFLAAGTGILLYIIAAVIIPEEPAGYAPPGAAGAAPAGSGQPGGSGPAPAPWRWGGPMTRSRDDGGGAIFLGLILVVVGGWFLVQRLIPGLDGRLVWPGLLILLGLFLVIGAMRRGGGAPR
jgi:phage shock protein C